MGNTVLLEPGVGAVVLNDTDVEASEVFAALDTHSDPLVAAMSRWSLQAQGDYGAAGTSRAGGLFERDRYVTPRKVFDQIRLAQEAAESDDVVSNVAETTEALAFSSMGFFCEDEDEQDVWNQIAGILSLDARLREMWRELFTASQFTIAVWWGRRDLKLRGKTSAGVRRKRTFSNMKLPIAMTLMDPLKVTPVGNPIFGGERLAYIADRGEAKAFDGALQALRDNDPTRVDPIVSRLILGRYTPDTAEKNKLQAYGVDTSNLFLLNPENVFRHTMTRPQYQPFAAVRMKSVFELLDLKQQLRQMDRAHLIGGTNFIVLIKKGTDTLPAKPEEVAHLQASVRTVARVPVIVGDHRLNVEIVTPQTDHTLDPKRYDAIDTRIAFRLYQMFMTGRSDRGDDSMKLARVVASGMESRRHMLRRTLEAAIIQPVLEANPELTEFPELIFSPKKIALDFDSNYASFLMDLRMAGDLSRETMLAQFDFNQEREARKRKREKDRYDDIFETQVPGAPARPSNEGTEPAEDPKSAGRRQGGNKNGGGAAPGSGQGQPARNPRKRSD